MKNETSGRAVLYIAVPTFFEIIFCMWYMAEMLLQSNLQSVAGMSVGTLENVVAVVVCTVLLLQIAIQQPYYLEELGKITGITILILIVTICSKISYMLSCWLFIVASKEMRFDRVARKAYFILIASTITIVALHLLGVIPQSVLYRGGRIRCSLGFNHPNVLGMRLFQISVLHSYLRKEFCIRDFLFMLLLAFLVWRIPNCQTACIGIFATAAFFVMQKYADKLNEGVVRKLYGTLECMVPIFGVLSILLMVIDTSKYKLLKLLDTLLAFRFSHAHLVYRIYGTSWFGQKVNLVTERTRLERIASRLFLDNGYAEILIRYGIIFFILFIFAYYRLMKKMAADKRRVLVIILGVYAIYGLMEGRFVRLSDNIFLLLFSEIIYQNRE